MHLSRQQVDFHVREKKITKLMTGRLMDLQLITHSSVIISHVLTLLNINLLHRSVGIETC
jgi:hypothetical protein